MSTKNNFLKIGFFNIEQEIKTLCEKGTEQVKDLETKLLDQRIKINSSPDYPNKEKTIQRIDRYLLNLKSIRERKAELYNWIDYLYKFGDQDVVNSKKEEKSKKTKSVSTKKKLSVKKTKSPK